MGGGDLKALFLTSSEKCPKKGLGHGGGGYKFKMTQTFNYFLLKLTKI